MNDEFLNRLAANDPAHSAEPDLTRIKARVDAHTAPNVVPMTRRSQYGRTLRVAAAVGVLALAGGIGFAGGSYRADSAIESPLAAVGSNDAAATAPGLDIAREGAGVGGAGDSKMVAGGYGGYWGGTVILKPGAELTNAAGTAVAYRLTSDGVDRKALIYAVADVVGIDNPTVTSEEGTYQVNEKNGRFNAYVGNDAQVWFNGYNNASSPWGCEQELAGDDGSGTTKTEITQAMSTKCDELWKAPSKADAIAAAKAAFAKLDLDGLQGAKYVAFGYNTRATTVSITPVIDGMDVAMQWSAEVSKDGVFSISGSAARVVKAASYPTVGARDAAARSELRKWMSFGPNQVWAPEQNFGVAESGSSTPTTRTVDGKPMVQAYVNDISVSSATRSLMQVWLADGTTMLMPAWNFTAKDGTVWQMIAITDAFVDWTQASNNGPIAYAADAGAMAK